VLALAPGLWLRLAYGTKYQGGTLEAVIVIGAIAQFVNFLRTPVQIALLAMGESSKIFLINCFSVVLLITVGIACVSTFGIVGAPVSQLIIGVVLLVVSRRFERTAMGAA
jgi:O-antigen/teichoic acid export membrane protein